VTTLERNLLAAPQEAHAKVEIYSGVARLARTVWASEVKAAGSTPTTALVWCHPTANFLGHYALGGLAERGFGGIGLTTRYVGNDTSLIMENCLLDMGSMVAHLRDRGYEKVILIGNSGGASIVPYYQAQAVSPSVTAPPGGGPDLTTAGLIPADAVGMFNAHPSRARLCTEWLDPAIVDEHQPFERDASLDMYHPANQPPFSAEFIARYREGQRSRNRRISHWAEGMLEALLAPGHFPAGLEDLAFVVQGTTADLRFLDGNIDPSDREIGVSLWGPPAVANYLPAGIGRCVTLRSWLNQWSLDHSLGDSLRWLPEITCPVFVGVGTADPVVVPQMARGLYDAASSSSSRVLVEIRGGTHYFENQPDLLAEALDALGAWAEQV
jgi:pimeloyl-ACP methyl ester carboxylesterase